MSASLRLRLVLSTSLAIACTPPGGATPAANGPVPAQQPAQNTADQIPKGLGRMRQEDISIKVELTNVTVQLLPLDEFVTRVLAPDTYDQVRKQADDKDSVIKVRARSFGLRERHVWMAIYKGLAPSATFTPGDLVITQSGREYHPLATIPVSARFGSRLDAGENQRALYLFDDGLNVTQPLTVSMGSERNTSWESILITIEHERAAIRARGPGDSQ